MHRSVSQNCWYRLSRTIGAAPAENNCDFQENEAEAGGIARKPPPFMHNRHSPMRQLAHLRAMPTGPRKARPDDRLRIEPGISRFPDVQCTSEVWSFGPSRNDGADLPCGLSGANV